MCSLQMRYGETWTPVRGQSKQTYPTLVEDEKYLENSEFIQRVWAAYGHIVDILEFRNQNDVRLAPHYTHGASILYANTALLYIEGSSGDWGGEKLFCTIKLYNL